MAALVPARVGVIERPVVVPVEVRLSVKAKAARVPVVRDEELRYIPVPVVKELAVKTKAEVVVVPDTTDEVKV